jgi:hypothetical protein
MHFLHAAPMVPQAVMLFPDWHMPELSQQPIRHVVALHPPSEEPELVPEVLPEVAVPHARVMHVVRVAVQF